MCKIFVPNKRKAGQYFRKLLPTMYGNNINHKPVETSLNRFMASWLVTVSSNNAIVSVQATAAAAHKELLMIQSLQQCLRVVGGTR